MQKAKLDVDRKTELDVDKKHNWTLTKKGKLYVDRKKRKKKTSRNIVLTPTAA
jgi:hypothetical protein